MEGLLWFLFLGVFFYLMMRFGCGAHMVHGQQGAGAELAAPKQTDPVCGMKVGPESGYGRMLGGRLYVFCSKQCLEQFDAAPERFLGKEAS